MTDEEEEEESSIDSPHTGAADRLKERSRKLQAQQQLLERRRQSPRFVQQEQQPTPPSTAKRALPLAKKKAAAATATASNKKRKEATAGKPPLAKKANQKKGATKVKQEIEIPKTKQPRYTPIEDFCLTRAWISASEDPVVGANRKGTAFWQCVKSKFDAIYELEAEVIQMFDHKSLTNRWLRHINKDVQLFLKYWKSATEDPPSGTTESDWMTTAKDNYLQEVSSPFRFEECFRVLKESPKFCIESNTEAQALANQEGRNSTEVAMGGSLQRPIGSKAAKKLKTDSSSSVTSTASSSVDKLAAAQEKIANAFILKDDRKMWYNMAQMSLQMGDTVGARMWMEKLAQSNHRTDSPTVPAEAVVPAEARVPTVPPVAARIDHGANLYNEDDELPPLPALGSKSTGLDSESFESQSPS